MRGFPAAIRSQQEKSLIEHHQTLTTEPPPVSEERLQLVYQLAKRVSRRVQKNNVSKALKRPEHVSLTNRSSFEFTREMGGRATEVALEFEIWAQEIVPEDRETLHPFGYTVFEKGGLPRWKTMIAEPLREEEVDLVFGQSYPSPLEGECVAGMNHNVGFQIIQMAYEELELKGIVRDFKVVGYGEMRSSCVPEPGGKARIYTIQSWERTIFLQPLGHFLVETLATLPEAESGLKRANVGWDWVNRLTKHRHWDSKVFKDFRVLTSDLERATDFADHRIFKEAIFGYLDGLQANTRYTRLATELLLSPLKLITKRT
jgi:hypothetical protein